MTESPAEVAAGAMNASPAARLKQVLRPKQAPIDPKRAGFQPECGVVRPEREP
jgi:hypothetical protein